MAGDAASASAGLPPRRSSSAQELSRPTTPARPRVTGPQTAAAWGRQVGPASPLEAFATARPLPGRRARRARPGQARLQREVRPAAGPARVVAVSHQRRAVERAGPEEPGERWPRAEAQGAAGPSAAWARGPAPRQAAARPGASRPGVAPSAAEPQGAPWPAVRPQDPYPAPVREAAGPVAVDPAAGCQSPGSPRRERPAARPTPSRPRSTSFCARATLPPAPHRFSLTALTCATR
jgi:hypothetical protein